MSNEKKSTSPDQLKRGDFLTLEVEKIVFGGDGLCRHQGIVIFVPFVLPNEVVKVEIQSVKKNLARAHLIEVISASPERVVPRCPVFQKCGGCDWQHISYKEQAKIKHSWLSDFFRKDVAVQTKDFLQSPEIWNYRNRVSLKKIDNQIGFFEKNSHKIVDITYCYIAEEEINTNLSRINRSRKSDQIPETIRISSAPENHLISDDQESFSQVNSSANRVLLNTVESILNEIPEVEYFYDFYSGSGNFSFSMCKSREKTQFFAIEAVSESVELGRQLIESKGFKNVTFFKMDASSYLKRNSIHKNSFVLLDPPRDGCSLEFIQGLAAQHLETVVYVSCNPSTAQRDWQRLQSLSPQKLELKTIQGLDMFPQTSHVEVILVIKASPY